MQPTQTPSASLSDQKPWIISDGSLETLKWIGLVLMAGDHVNKYLLEASVPALFDLGRLVMPIFGFVLMHNLCRPGAFSNGAHLRVMKRLTVFGLLATPASAYLVGSWPLNVLFLLLAATLVAYLWQSGGRANRACAVGVFVLGGALVEFWWPGLLFCLAAWAFIRRPTRVRLVLWFLATASLALVNGNFAALPALPLIWAATRFTIPAPRIRWAFYAFYPAHLSVLATFLALT